MIKRQFWLGLLLLVMLAMSLQVVNAQVTPRMTVYGVWTPDEQLTSTVGDERFVDLHLYAQGNVPFWAVNISCTVGTQTVLDFISLSFPASWGAANDDYYVNPSGEDLYTGTGVLAFTATRLGSDNTPLGRNGVEYTQLVATARFKVKELTANSQAAVTCTIMEFIDRNGAVVIRGTQTRLNNLMIYVGYSLAGTVRRQGTTLNQNIKVTCGVWDYVADEFVPSSSRTVFTTATGAFSFGGATLATALRNFGLYRCQFESQFVQNVSNQQILLGYMDFELDTAVKQLLPVTLRSGDASMDNTVDFNDIVSITSGFTASANTAFNNPNDMNGDGRVTRMDIIFTAGNIGLSDVGAGLFSEHALYGIGRDYATNVTFPNSRIWLGSPYSGDVSNFNTRSTTRDFWPMLSPDGTTIAYVSQDRVSGRHKLAYLATASGVISPTTFPASFTYDAFAPSWSPDGNRIAFVCAVQGANAFSFGYLYNRGDICVVNAADRAGAQINRLGVDARIFPPAWISYDTDTGTAAEETGYILLYGGSDGDIHYYNFVTEAHGVLTMTGAAGADVDMPVAVNYLYPGAGSSYLAYRYNDGDGIYDPRIRVGTIGYSNGAFTGEAINGLGTEHVEIVASEGVDYFDVSPGLDIMFYGEYNYAVANPGVYSSNPFAILTLEHDNANPLSWFAAEIHVPDSSVGNPIGVVNSDQVYNPTLPSNSTYLFAWRMTFDYVP